MNTLERARRVFDAHIAVFDPDSTSDYAEFLTHDAVYEFPYAPAGYPAVVEGRDAAVEYMIALPPLGSGWKFWDVTFSETANPDVVFIEFEGSAEANTGRHYRQTYIARLELRGEKIARYREFWNPQVVVDAFTP